MKQLTLIDAPETEWECSDDWETPKRVALLLAALVKPDDQFIVEPSAGTGQIAKFLPAQSVCIEVNSCRASIGAADDKHIWILGDFLEVTPQELAAIDPDFLGPQPDLIIGNPPFSLWVEFLIHSLALVRPGGRVVFVGPCDTFHKPEATIDRLGSWQQRITITTHPIVGRVAYLKNGRPVTGRQIYDSIFEVVKL